MILDWIPRCWAHFKVISVISELAILCNAQFLSSWDTSRQSIRDSVVFMYWELRVNAGPQTFVYKENIFIGVRYFSAASVNVTSYLEKFPIQFRFCVKLRRWTKDESGQAPKVKLNCGSRNCFLKQLLSSDLGWPQFSTFCQLPASGDNSEYEIL